jgi:solute carrier family 5 (sodium-coupled monocarboxylate transporter), member 8/12
MSWLSFNAQYAIALGHMNFPPKELQADQCPYEFIPSNSTHNYVSDDDIFPFYRISYMWYTLVGAIFTMSISLICSVFIFGFNDPKNVSSELIAPAIRKRIFKDKKPPHHSREITKDTEF